MLYYESYVMRYFMHWFCDLPSSYDTSSMSLLWNPTSTEVSYFPSLLASTWLNMSSW